MIAKLPFTHRPLPQGQYRSRTEYFFAEWLAKHSTPFSYEPESFDLGEDVIYTPDFLLHGETPIWVEVKPAAFIGESYKMRRLVEIFEEAGVRFLAWIVDIQNREPVCLEIYEPMYRECFPGSGLGYWTPPMGPFFPCYGCQKPQICGLNTGYDCTFCGNHNT